VRVRMRARGVSVSVPKRSFETEREFISRILFLRKQIHIPFPLLENENAFPFPETRDGGRVPILKNGERI
jgi:hypothetical protein